MKANSSRLNYVELISRASINELVSRVCPPRGSRTRNQLNDKVENIFWILSITQSVNLTERIILAFENPISKNIHTMKVLAPFSIDSSPLAKHYTLDDLNSFPEPEGHSIMELINGASSLPLPSLNRMIEKIELFLRKQILSEKSSGIVFRPRDGIQIENYTWLEPDLFFLTSETESKFRTTNPNTADLVVEVLSESTREYDKKTKADTYATLRVSELRLVDKQAKTVEVRENLQGKTAWSRILFYTWEEILVSQFLEISIILKFLKA